VEQQDAGGAGEVPSQHIGQLRLDTAVYKALRA
jgi:hypothetical protein